MSSDRNFVQGDGVVEFVDGSSASRGFRSVCYRCHKPVVVCVCSTVPHVQNRTDVIILQHPRERFHPIGTVRFAKLGLEKVRVWVEGPARSAPDVRLRLETSLPAGTGLLFPGPGARVLSEVPLDERPSTLLVLDGTWAQAKSLYRSHDGLSRLPQFSLAPKKVGQYRIRREPTAYALSTIEAVVEALSILEPETPRLDELLEAFTRMIDRQIDYTKLARPRRPRRPRRSSFASVPRVLVDEPERVVLCHGEFVAPQGGPTEGSYGLVYWAGLCLATGEAFQAFVRPSTVSPTDRVLGHMGFSRADLDSGASMADVLERWRAFLGDRVMVAWNKSTLDFFGAIHDGRAETMALKTVYCNARRARAGALAEALAHEGLEPIPTPFHGRPRRVMGGLFSIARWLGDRAREVSFPP